jgi:hypothetical protein
VEKNLSSNESEFNQCYLDFFSGINGSKKVVIIDANKNFSFYDDEVIEFNLNKIDFNSNPNHRIIKFSLECLNNEERYIKVRPFLEKSSYSGQNFDSLQIEISSYDELLGFFEFRSNNFVLKLNTFSDSFLDKISIDSTIQIGLKGKSYFNLAPNLKLNEKFIVDNKTLKFHNVSKNKDSIKITFGKIPELNEHLINPFENFENFILKPFSIKKIYIREKNTLMFLWKTNSIESVSKLRQFDSLLVSFEDKITVRGILFNDENEILKEILKQERILFKNYIVSHTYPFPLFSKLKIDCFPTILIFNKRDEMIFNACNPEIDKILKILNELDE